MTMVHRRFLCVLVLVALLSAPSRAGLGQEDQIDQLGKRAVAAGRAAGISIAVQRRGHGLIVRGYGQADLENAIAATPETVYEIASITKTFTAAGILKLVEEGKLQLDDEVGRLLPDYPAKGHPVTVRQLLNHTSGIRSMTALGARYWAQVGRDIDVAEGLKLFQDEPFEFEPGQRYAYNNSGYFLLGAILEKRGGLPYGQYVEQRLVRAAGLQGTFYGGTDSLIPHRARGYSRSGERLVNARHVSLTQGFSAGGICSTASDLVSWFRELFAGRIIGGSLIDQMTRPDQLPDGTRLSYGYGVGVGHFGSHRMLYHAGGIFGFDAMAADYPDDGLTIAVLINTDGDLAEEIEHEIARLSLGIALPTDHPLPAAATRIYVGTYTGTGTGAGSGAVAHVRQDATGLILEFDEAKTRLLHQDGSHFALEGKAQEVDFEIENGRAMRLKITQYGALRFQADRR